MIDPQQQTQLLTNSLVVVTSSDVKAQVTQLKDLLQPALKKIAIGIPESVPAGKYAEEALQHDGIWHELQSKIVQAKDVRQVLQYVETGNADAGIVYKTDALTTDQVNVAFQIDAVTYTPIEYPMGIIKSTAHHKEVETFYTYLQSEAAMNIFTKYGFSTVENK